MSLARWTPHALDLRRCGYIAAARMARTPRARTTLRLDARGTKAAKAAIAKPMAPRKAERALLNGAPTLTPCQVDRERAE